MSFKITIPDGALQKSIESVSFYSDPPNDFDDMHTYIKHSLRINGKIGTEENISVLSDWAQLPATDDNCYKELIVEETLTGQLIRKFVFSTAFVIRYSESYTSDVVDKADNKEIGYFSLLAQQVDTIDIECTNENTIKLAKKQDNNSTKPVLAVPYGTQLTKEGRQSYSLMYSIHLQRAIHIKQTI